MFLGCWTCSFRCRYRPWDLINWVQLKTPRSPDVWIQQMMAQVAGMMFGEEKHHMTLWNTDGLMDWIGWVIDWLIDWLLVWLIDWLIDQAYSNSNFILQHYCTYICQESKTLDVKVAKIVAGTFMSSPPIAHFGLPMCSFAQAGASQSLGYSESVKRLRCECVMCLNLLTNSSKVSNGWNGIFMELLTTSLEKRLSTYCTQYNVWFWSTSWAQQMQPPIRTYGMMQQIYRNHHPLVTCFGEPSQLA